MIEQIIHAHYRKTKEGGSHEVKTPPLQRHPFSSLECLPPMKSHMWCPASHLGSRDSRVDGDV